MTSHDGFSLAFRTANAYSAFRYGTSGWTTLATLLLKHGLTEKQAEMVLRSKWTRWAADAQGGRYGHVSGRKAFAFLLEQKTLTPAKLAELEASL